MVFRWRLITLQYQHRYIKKHLHVFIMGIRECPSVRLTSIEPYFGLKLILLLTNLNVVAIFALPTNHFIVEEVQDTGEITGTDQYKFRSNIFIVLIDVFSWFWFVSHLTSTTTANIIKVLRGPFYEFGIPLEVIPDSGPSYTSKDFAGFVMLILCYVIFFSTKIF